MLNPYKGGEFRVTSPYGTRAFEGGEEFHFGLDLVGESGKELLSICNGRVIQSRIVSDKSNITWQWGNYIIIQAETGERVIYAHLSKRFVFLGDKVKKGDVIGIEGNTGYCFGSHCHLEVRDTENRVTTEVNTPAYTKIPNKTGKYKIKEEKNMTSEETQAMINASKERIWHFWDEIEREVNWAYKPLMALYKKKLFVGATPSDLNLNQTKLETLVVMARGFKELGLIDY